MNTEHDKPTPPPGFKLVKACELKAPFSDRLLVYENEWNESYYPGSGYDKIKAEDLGGWYATPIETPTDCPQSLLDAANFARKLERERDEVRVELRKLRIENNHNWQAIEFAEEAVKKRDEALKQCGQLKAMRDAIKEAHGAISQCLKYILKLPLSGSDAECEVMDDAHHALRKLKPFINAVVCDGPAILICSMCEGVTTNPKI